MLDLFLFIGYKTFQQMNGSLAQLEEHLVYTERVGSSNLSTPTSQEALLLKRGFCFIYAEEVRTPSGVRSVCNVFFKGCRSLQKTDKLSPVVKKQPLLWLFFCLRPVSQLPPVKKPCC